MARTWSDRRGNRFLHSWTSGAAASQVVSGSSRLELSHVEWQHAGKGMWLASQRRPRAAARRDRTSMVLLGV